MTDFKNLSYLDQRNYQLICQILEIWHIFSDFNTMKIDYYTSFYSGQYYHIYNRGNNNEKIFYEPDNYYFFLKRYDEYLSNILETYAYCLLPNHFHLLIKVIDRIHISEQFRLFFLSYSKAINQQKGRVGSLFQKRFKRTVVESTSSICRAIVYIHTNPFHHNIISEFKIYKYSSFQSLISDKATKLNRKGVLELFGSKYNFIKFHQERIKQLSAENFFIED